MRRLTFADLQDGRLARGTLALLFITDNCPVGCAHCSVDSRPDSPRIRDFELFEEIVDGLCALPADRIIGISGGEPFVERRGLSLATERIAATGKQMIIYTSGFWGPDAEAGHGAPEWARKVIRRASAIFLSTDAYHEASVHERRFAGAARAVAEEQVWLVVQVMDGPGMVERAEELLRGALGVNWSDHAEIATAPPLNYGRARDLEDPWFGPRKRFPAEAFGTCPTANVQVIRYDGTATACCNETVIMGAGPRRMRRRTTTADEVTAAIDGLRDDPLFRAVGTVGPGMLTAHPRFQDLAGREYGSICELCWVMARRLPEDGSEDGLVDAIRVLAGHRKEQTS
ncbi:hypothetical protein G5C60_17920 [Streptomyces sp. HC44]|uniref:Radical SAM core domain-containing protein n=1 Tax=Streptomyces scabichelini TaxID=2711217 RepID=A0A6G4V5R5_9ACTN|nr:radical SAM protein [Streptomyces scabichelini]NGO09422.1 hypothetical protein [Streptomyces scabichelini]